MQNLQAVLISPHPPALVDALGYGSLKEAASTITGMSKLSYILSMHKPKVVIYISPHGNMFSDAICILDEEKIKGDLRKFGAPQVAYEKTVSRALNEAIKNEFELAGIPHIFLNREKAKKYGVQLSLDHGVIVPMYYIDKAFKDYEIVHITPGGLRNRELFQAGKALSRAIEEAGLFTVVVASGDLSHYLLEEGPYGYRKEGELLDKEIVTIFKEERIADLVNIDHDLIERGGECGLKGFIMAAGMFDMNDVNVSVYSYEGPFGVGYMTASLLPADANTAPAFTVKKKAYEDPYIELARMAIEKYVKEGTQLEWNEYKKYFSASFIREAEALHAGAFVSIHKNKDLRGCIGTISPTTENLAEEIIYCAIEACSADPRFYPVTKGELEFLDIKVDVLSQPEDIDDKSMLDEKRYGVIVSKGVRRGLLLPNLEGVNSIDEQLKIAKRKAGIDENDENIRIKRFEVVRHEQRH